MNLAASQGRYEEVYVAMLPFSISFYANLGVTHDPHLTFAIISTTSAKLSFSTFIISPNSGHLSPFLRLRSSSMPHWDQWQEPSKAPICQKRRFPMWFCKFECINFILHTLSLLPVHLRIMFKILFHTHQCLHSVENPDWPAALSAPAQDSAQDFEGQPLQSRSFPSVEHALWPHSGWMLITKD